MFVLDEEFDPPAYPADFQKVEVKDEPMEYDAVSCDLFYHHNSMFIFIIYNIEDLSFFLQGLITICVVIIIFFFFHYP